MRLNEARLQALVQLNQMAGASLQEITDFALESAVALTNSTIGYLAFMNEDETVLTMHSWSKTAMAQCAIIDKPIVYPVIATGLWGEAVRQRKPVITNDYPAPNPLKKGHPEGHVKVLRHMNAPIFDGDRIVIVAGVGNKAAPYDDSDVRQLTLLMQGMWLVQQRALAEDRLRKARDELELRVRERTADLTRANVELERAKQAAEAASRAKSTFLANMSHEIRTPLNAVIGMTELVLKGPLSAQQREFLMTVRDSGESLLSVINDILDFSKIEAGKLALDNSAFDLRESLVDTMKSFAIRAHQRDLELTCFIHPEVPHLVVGDYNRLRQVVTNLVGNAIKFTDQGEIDLEVTQDCRSQHDVVLHFTVSDTGIGIPREKQATIFEMFEQADSSTSHRHGGTGLGLAIAARLVSLMDGRIWLESEVGRGSRFHFVVRLSLAEGEPLEPVARKLLRPAAQQPDHVPSLHILLAEDSLVNQKLAVALLEGQGHTVTLAGNGKAAVAATAAQKFDLVLMDVQMPEMDGLEAAAQIRAREQQTGAHLPIIAMTAHALKGDRERCLAAGMDNYVAKPIRAEELFEAIDAIFSDRKRDSATESAVPQDVVNWVEALKTVQGNGKVLKSMAEAALEEIPQLMTAIRQAIARNDHAKLKFAAHTLKGSMRYFGASHVCGHAAKLEDMGRRGELADAEASFAALEGEIARVAAVLVDYLRKEAMSPDSKKLHSGDFS